MFATRATVHSTNRPTPMQLIFGQDAILNVKHEADWTYIKERKNKISKKNNYMENKTHKEYKYKIDDLVLIKAPTNIKYGTDAYLGPFKVVKLNENGTIKTKIGFIEDNYNFRNIKAHYE